MRALDELLTSWRANPDAEATIAVCSFLGSSKRDELIREVGASAETWHGNDGEVMIAVGRMYLEAEMLQQAQTCLVAAGKANSSDPRAFGFLGEVLLRRGDAVRAEKVLSRALALGGNAQEVGLWHERAVVYSALQKRVGSEAVAAEVARSMPVHLSNAPPPNPDRDSLDSFSAEVATRPRNDPPRAAGVGRKATLVGLAEPGPPLPRFGSAPGGSGDPIRISDADLLEPSSPALTFQSPLGLPPPPASASANVADALANTFLAGGGGGAAAKPGVSKPAEGAKRSPKVTQIGGFRPAPGAAPAPPMQFDDAVTVITPPPFMAQVVAQTAAAPQKAAAQPAPIRKPSPPPFAPPPSPKAPSRPPSPPSPPPPPPTASYEASLPVTVPAPPLEPLPSTKRAPSHDSLSDSGSPAPAVVLQHLARVGLYEPTGGAAPAWETPPRQKARGAAWILIATVLIAAAGGGAYEYHRRVKHERALEADALNTQVAKLLNTGSPSDLKSTDQKLTRSFELDSRSQRAGRLWLENRILNALLLAGETRGIDAAVHRGRQVELPENALLAGKIASFLVEGDVAGGAAMLVHGDKEAGTDAYYQLAAAAVLERAGDGRAVERYRAAVALAPELAPAEMLLARLLLLEAGPEGAKPVLESLREKLGDVPMTRALSGLSWVVTPDRSDEPPAEAQLAPGDIEKLPAPLAAVPAMVDAARALNKQDLPAASRAIDSAINLAQTPALAAGLGFLAIEAGDEVVARKAALRALQFSGVYPKARTLAARVALLGGRLDEAQKAIEELDPASADVAIVRAVVAYESQEAADLKGALEALGNSAVGAAFSALEAAPGVVNGSAFPPPDKLEELASPEKPWGELIAIDTAIETGSLGVADKLLSKRPLESLRPVYLKRLARLRRLQGKLDEALRASAAAAEGGMSLSLLLERVYELLGKDDVAGAKQLAAKYPTLLGPLSGWVGVLTDVASKQAASATVRLTKLDLPPDESSIAVRVLVARALVVGKDKRAKPYLTALLKKLPKNPDVLAAATLSAD